MQFEYEGKTYQIEPDAKYLYFLSEEGQPYYFDIGLEDRYVYILSWLPNTIPPCPYEFDWIKKEHLEKSAYLFYATEVTNKPVTTRSNLTLLQELAHEKVNRLTEDQLKEFLLS